MGIVRASLATLAESSRKEDGVSRRRERGEGGEEEEGGKEYMYV